MFKPLNLQLFSDNPPQDPPADPPKPDDKPVKTFTQAELDEILEQRLSRERKKFADYDEVRTKLTALEKAEQERQTAEMTEVERLKSERDTEKSRAEQLADERDNAINAANQRLIKAEFRAKARELGVRADALEDAFKLADLSAVEVDDDGNVPAVHDVVEALLKDKPYLAEQAKPKPRKIGEGVPPEEAKDKTKEQQLKDAAEKARKSGKPEDRAAYAALKVEFGI